MCGIVAAIAERNVVPILIEGLRRLEYRGYDSAGLAGIEADPGTEIKAALKPEIDSPERAITTGAPASDRVGRLHHVRAVGKVATLADTITAQPVKLTAGVAHTRWATHGAPSERNAHPHVAGGRIAVVHNGIIENHRDLEASLASDGYHPASETDSECVALWLLRAVERGQPLTQAMAALHGVLRGAFALVVIDRDDPEHLYATRKGSPLVIGLGLGEHFAASDAQAIAPVTSRLLRLEDGDVAVLSRERCVITRDGQAVERPVEMICGVDAAVDHAGYRHYMEKEIFEQPTVLAETLEGRIEADKVIDDLLGPATNERLSGVSGIHFVACGTSYHAAQIARHWCETLVGIPATAEIASERRYRRAVVPSGTLLVVISQSGETADTLSVLRAAAASDDSAPHDFGTAYRARIAICNRPDSAMVREADAALLTRAGAEIGVASTKAFTTQLLALGLLVLRLAQERHPDRDWRAHVAALVGLPAQAQIWLDAAQGPIEELAAELQGYDHALFLGRGAHFPIALEGALKLKEISYIHAEAYPAGELKHGPLALIDERMPVVVVAPSDPLLEKLMANLQEVRARGGRLFVISDRPPEAVLSDDDRWLQLPAIAARADRDGDRRSLLSPILMTLPLQLLAYHVARLRGTDVDRPRNLAKSVTVE